MLISTQTCLDATETWTHLKLTSHLSNEWGKAHYFTFSLIPLFPYSRILLKDKNVYIHGKFAHSSTGSSPIDT
jgi:hypothetical protein